jgi:adenylate kinase
MKSAVNSSRVIIFLGAPGSGKGTQSSWLSTQLHIPCLSTGEALRTEARRTTPSGVRLRRVLASGKLVSDDVVCEVVGARVKADAPKAGLILDGFPRTAAQARYLDSLLSDLGLARPLVIHLHVAKHKLLQRLTGRRHCAVCGAVYNLNSRPSLRGPRCEDDGGLLVERDDDREEVVLRRLQEFEGTTATLLDYYRTGDYHRVDGERDLDAVASELLYLATAAPAVMAA